MEDDFSELLPSSNTKPEKEEVEKVETKALAPLVGGLETIPDCPSHLVRIETRTAVTKEQRKLLDAALYDSVLYGCGEAAITCRGEGTGLSSDDDDKRVKACPYINQCSLRNNGIDLGPYIGKECPIEKAFIMSWMQGFQQEMKIKPGDAASAYDQSVAQQMAGLQLMRRRAMLGMAEDPILEKVFENISAQGSITTVHGNVNADYLMKAMEMARKLADQSVVSRKSRAQHTKDGLSDPSQRAANLTNTIRGKIKTVERRVKLDEEGQMAILEEITRFEDGKERDDSLS